ncbi:hypothetical protein A1OE_25 [Candidatus Endolissoclinum faulkneri L2]|uniref:Uncharacterized protein n=1 Tax=Candidatus Endolissoclinum faulkneri L2 TaxID=1193729 RepID=K7YF85_9PROT|nr:hypothetical protein A1OE_25 [Candidatus Endolissoclinum faulkneri L2]
MLVLIFVFLMFTAKIVILMKCFFILVKTNRYFVIKDLKIAH